jgi:predicted ATPase with chaperone activity
MVRRPAAHLLLRPLGVQRYLARVSGPLLDRIDIHLEVRRCTTRGWRAGWGRAE